MNIKPIETVYNGYRFRSRAEARWAVFFDAVGIDYVYEPEGVILSDGTRYLPDFYLPKSDTWFEVKGVLTKTDLHKVEQLVADTGKAAVIGYSDLSFQASENWRDFFELTGKASSVLCKCHKCNQLWFMGIDGLWNCLCCGEYDGDHHFDVVMNGDSDLRWCSDETVINAFNKARQARFEHGEAPT